MSSYINCYEARCHCCENRVNIVSTITMVLNLDATDIRNDEFLQGSLNKVRCPICKESFTYETTMIIFSEKNKFAYLVEPMLSDAPAYTVKPPLHQLLPDDYKYRMVRYQIEAKEKYDIEISGLNDIVIEYIKLKCFPDDVAMPFDDKSLIFKSRVGDTYTFYQTDCRDAITNVYALEFRDEDIPEKILNINPCQKEWQKIDRISLQEEL